MRKLLVPFILWDKGFQWIVDHAAFFLMRRFGIDKPMVRCLFISLMTGCVGVKAVENWATGDAESRGASIFVLLIFAGLSQVILRHERSLPANVRSQMDEISSRTTKIGLGMRLLFWPICLWMIAKNALILTGNLAHPESGLSITHLSLVVSLIATFGFMAAFYVTDTPDEPPVKHTASDLADQSV